MTHLIRVRLHSLGETLSNGAKATGKEPRDRAWQRSTVDTPPQPGENYGILPGPSGRACLDVEPAGMELFPRPSSGCVVDTPSGGYHLWLWLAACELVLGPLRKKLKKTGPKRIILAELHTFGSQVLGPGCRAWSDKAKREGVYTLAPGCSLDELGPPPAGYLEQFQVAPAPATIAPAPHVHAERWAWTVLQRECDAVATTGEGGRNERLNLAAFRVGQVVGAGLLDLASSGECLVVAGMKSGLSDREARDTTFRAIEAGRGYPRGPARAGSVEIELVETVPTIADSPPPTPGTKTVLLPGGHKLPTGEYLEVSNSDFADSVLDAVPRGTLYRRDRVAGFVEGARFVQASETTVRRLCDPPNVRLARWVKVKGDEGGDRQALVFEPCPAPAAGLILDAAAGRAPEIKLLTSYPVVLPDRTISPPGYHAASGTLYAGEAVEPLADAGAIREHLLDLVVDFPFEDAASRANFLGLMLTPMLRPMVGKIPLHLVTSPQAGTGKSRLIEDYLGITYTGEPLPSSQFPERGEERAKWLTALLLGGASILHLDNLTSELDSGNLASVLTSHSTNDRVLGSSTFPTFRNTLTVAASGNNTRLSSELARRAVIVRLVWTGAGRPDDRTEFIHPDSTAYATERRRQTLAAIVGAYTLWERAGAPRAPVRLGSFEAWSGVVGGILSVLGIDEHLGNREAWRSKADAEARSIQGLLLEWIDRIGPKHVTASTLAGLLGEQLEVCGAKRDSAASAGRKVAKMADRRVQLPDGREVTIRYDWSPELRQDGYWIELAGLQSPAKTEVPQNSRSSNFQIELDL